MKNNWKNAINILKKDGAIVAPTDTIYGVIGDASSKKAVESVYRIRSRDLNKPCIVLISSYNDLKKLGISITKEQKKFLEIVWPGKVSVVFPVVSKKLSYLHRGGGSIAFRMIGLRNKNLYGLINKIGPLVAPSANPQGKAPSKNITEAKEYFGDKISLYINSGTKVSKPSTLVSFENNKIAVLREGAVKINISK